MVSLFHPAWVEGSYTQSSYTQSGTLVGEKTKSAYRVDPVESSEVPITAVQNPEMPAHHGDNAPSVQARLTRHAPFGLPESNKLSFHLCQILKSQPATLYTALHAD